MAHNLHNTLREFKLASGRSGRFYSLPPLEQAGVGPVSRLPGLRNAAAGPPSTAKGDWIYYNADIKGSKYSPLDQIHASNFNKLEVAWRFKTE